MKDYRNYLKINNKQLLSAVQLIVLPLFLSIIFFFIYQLHVSLSKDAALFDYSQEVKTETIAPYPLITKPYTPVLSAESAVIMDNESKVFIYEKNALLRFPMASTTKLMTALVALEAFTLQDTLLVFSDNAAGSVIGIRKGEQYSLESLLYAMLLPSANDAAQAIADNYPGGRKAFVSRMNEKAKELSLYDTVYFDPAGLEDEGNYTTAKDLARLASYAITDKTISKITSTKYSTITDRSGAHQIALQNLNELLGINGIVGIKTGFTEGARGVLTTARKDSEGHVQILVVMRSADRFADTLQLTNLITGNLSYITPNFMKMPLGVSTTR